MEAIAYVPEQSAVQPRTLWNVYVIRILIWVIFAGICASAAYEGMKLRVWMYDFTDPIRFQDDMKRGAYWGLEASGQEGYLNQYEKMDPQVSEEVDPKWTPWLDYSPLRLAVMDMWGHYERVKFYKVESAVPLNLDAWQRSYDFAKPVLWFNTSMEGLAAIFAFFLTRHWVIRGGGDERFGQFNGIWQGLAAALLIWFSPDMIINAHAWAQWDTWIVPWFLLACLLASLDWWFAAGLAIAIGANFKGQMFPITPIFLIWPLVQGRVGAALRWSIGTFFGYMAIVSGWLLSYLPADKVTAARAIQEGLSTLDFPPDLFAIHRIFDVPAAIWIAEMVIIAAAVPLLLHELLPKDPANADAKWKRILYSRWAWYVSAAILIALTVCWPWFLERNRHNLAYGILFGGVVAACSLLFPRRSLGYVAAGVAAGGLLGCIWLFHGSTSWWDCAVHYGSVHWLHLFIGPTSNIPSIFAIRFGWSNDVSDIAFTLPAIQRHWPAFIVSRAWWPAFSADITAKMMFNSVYTVMLILSGIAIGIQTKRNDRRALIAFATPWIILFLFPVQMQERYLLYGAAASLCCIGESVGMAMLGIMLTFFSLMMPTKIFVDVPWSDVGQLGENLSKAFPWLCTPDAGYTIKRYLDGTQPDIAYGILVIGMIFLYMSLTKSKRSRELRVTSGK